MEGLQACRTRALIGCAQKVNRNRTHTHTCVALYRQPCAPLHRYGAVLCTISCLVHHFAPCTPWCTRESHFLKNIEVFSTILVEAITWSPVGKDVSVFILCSFYVNMSLPVSCLSCMSFICRFLCFKMCVYLQM